MQKINIGLLKEGKIPIDRRTPLTPNQAVALQKAFPHVKVYCQSSTSRAFGDDEYREAGIEVVDKLSHCDILLGVKEVPASELVPGKTFLFFSHTIKKQVYNRVLLQQILKQNIRLIDYEVLRDDQGNRIIGFGRYAGIVGAYNGIWTYGKRFGLFDLKRAYECFNLEELRQEFEKVKLPPIKIALTGGGRVGKGAMEVLHGMNIKQVSAEAYLNENFSEAVFCNLRSSDYYQRRDGAAFDQQKFYKNPQPYNSTFNDYAHHTDLLIAAAYWNPNAAPLFIREDMKQEDFSIKVIADITCDIDGSIPSTKRPSTIEEPVYDYDPSSGDVKPPFSEKSSVNVMAIDNLPCELPRDASEDFGKQLMHQVIPHLLQQTTHPVIENATITKEGKLTPQFYYLQEYIEGRG